MRHALDLLLAFCLVAACIIGAGCSKDDDEVTPPPTISISIHASSPASANVMLDAADVPVLLFTVNGDPDEGVLLGSLVVTLGGTAADTAMDPVALHLDDGAGSAGSFDSGQDTQLSTASFSGTAAVLDISPAHTIPAGGSVDFFVVMSLASASPPAAGDTFGASILYGGDVLATSATTGLAATVGGAPVDGSLFTVAGRLQITAGASMPAAASYPVSTADIPMLQLNLLSPDEDMTVDSLTISGIVVAGSNSQIAGVKLVVDANGSGAYESGTDGPFLGTTQTYASGSTATFAASRALTQGVAETWLVLYDFSASHNTGDGFRASIAGAADASGTGSDSGGAIVQVSPAPITGNAMTVCTTILGALSLAAGGKTPAGANVSPSGADVLLLHFTLTETSSTENATLSSLRFVLTGGGSPAGSPQADVALVELYRDDGDATFETGGGAGDDPLVSSGTVTASNDVTLSSLAELLPSGGSISYYVSIDLSGSSQIGSTLTLSLAPGDVTATGDTSACALAVSGSVVNGRTVGFQGAIAISDGGQTPTSASVANNATDVLMLHISVAETTGSENATLSGIRVVLTGAGSPAGNPQTEITQVRLFRDDGDNVFEPGGGGSDDPILGSGAVTAANDVTFSALTEAITAGSSLSYYVAIDLNGTASSGSNFTLSVGNADVSVTGNVSSCALTVAGGPVNARTVVIGSVYLTVSVASGDASIANFVRRTDAATNANAPAALFNLAPTGDAASISAVTLTHSGNASGQNHITGVKLYADVGTTAGVVDGSDVPLAGVMTGYSSGNTVTLTLGTARVISAGSNEDWLVTYDISMTCPYGRTFQAQVANSADITATAVAMATSMNVTGTPAAGGSRSLEGSWAQITTSGTMPGTNGRLLGFVWGYDSFNNQMIVQGGRDDGSTMTYVYFTDTWALSLTQGSEAWSSLNAGGGANDPPALVWHYGTVFDVSSTPYLMVCGGRINGSTINQGTYVMDLSNNTWTNVGINGPDRINASAVFDSANSRILVFGGWSGTASANQNDVWALSVSGSTPSWAQLVSGSAAGAPCIRQGAQCMIDTTTNPHRMIVHGGTTGGSTSTDYNDVFALSLGSTPAWTQLATAVDLRGDHRGAYDSTAHQFIVFGGWDAMIGPLNTLESMDLALNAPSGTWGYKMTPATNPSTRYWHGAVWDAASKRYVIYGGEAGMGSGRPDVWDFR